MRYALFLPLLALSACNNSGKVADSHDTKTDVLLVNMDSSVSPGANFFMYANGGWIKNNPIPGDQSAWGIGNVVVDENLKRLQHICQQADSVHPAKGSIEQKIGDFYASGMDSAGIEKTGYTALQPWLDSINAMQNTNDLMRVAGALKPLHVNVLFRDGINQDQKNSEKMIYSTWQGGLGMPDKAFYFRTDSSSLTKRAKYKNYLTDLFKLSGSDTALAARQADTALNVETALAKVSRDLKDTRDPERNYTKLPVSQLNGAMPELHWNTYLNAFGIASPDTAMIGQIDVMKSINGLIGKFPLSAWKNYYKASLLRAYSTSMPEAFGQAAFQYAQALSGVKERSARWKRVLQSEEGLLGEAMGQVYVKEYFSKDAKERYAKMVENVRDAMKERISKLTWMSDSTKQKAYTKLAAINKKVGYPDKWKDFGSMDIVRNNYLLNNINANIWWHKYELNKLGKPVDKSEWNMTPQTYNAYYDASNNEIVLPAAIFIVPGYNDDQIDDAVAYGYVAASTIGHELTHGFDDEGRKFDAQGNLTNWWTSKDSTEFTRRAKVMIDQFNGYEPFPGYKINGEATLGENIADLGGIVIGLDAFKKTEQYKKGEKINGLTPLQRYFMGYALGWYGHMKPELLKTRLLSDVHSPAEYRVNGPMADVDEFYQAFNIKPTDSLYRPDSLRVRIW